MSAEEQVAARVSRETFERLEIYAALLKKWNARINLVSPTSLNTVWQRHILDSVQLFELTGDWARWVDLGSGAGLPGLIIAAGYPERDVALVESDARKCAFLRSAAREMGLDVTILSSRIEEVSQREADVISARALAPLNQLLVWSQSIAPECGQLVFPKGKSWKKEVEVARESWSFDLQSVKSLSDPESAVLLIKEVRRA